MADLINEIQEDKGKITCDRNILLSIISKYLKSSSPFNSGINDTNVRVYEIDGVSASFTDPLLTAFFAGVLKPFIDTNKEKYEKKCKKNAENVAKRWNKNIPDDAKNADVYNGIQANTVVYDGTENVENSPENDVKSDTVVYAHMPPYTKDTKNTEYDYDNDYDK